MSSTVSDSSIEEDEEEWSEDGMKSSFFSDKFEDGIDLEEDGPFSEDLGVAFVFVASW